MSFFFLKKLTELIGYIKKFILEFSPKFQSLINLIDNDLVIYIRYRRSIYVRIGFVSVDFFQGPLADTLPAPFGDEIKGIADASGIDLGDVVFYNIFYEIFTICTSIVAQDSQGKMYHARNLDFGLFLGWDLSNDVCSFFISVILGQRDFSLENSILF